MMKQQRYNRRDVGPNPDPECYILISTKEGCYYRLKRGLNKPANLNSAYLRSAESTKLCSPAAKRMVRALTVHLRGLQTGRLMARFTGALKKAYHRNGALDFSFFKDYDFQVEHPLETLLKVPYQCEVQKGMVQVQIPIDGYSVRRLSGLVSGYYFDLTLLWGDALKEEGLRVDSVTSPLYSFVLKEKSTCTLSLPLPDEVVPWMAMLKVSSLEGNELAHHPRHYGMKVVKVG